VTARGGAGTGKVIACKRPRFVNYSVFNFPDCFAAWNRVVQF
jgi:hypothetical protein